MESDVSDLDDLLGGNPQPAPINPIPAVLAETELAQLFGITASQVRTRAREGLFVRVAPNRFDVRASLSGYLDQLRRHASRSGRPASGETGELAAEKLRLARAQAEKLELQNLAARGELVPVDEVRRQWVTTATDLRSGIMAIPSRVSARMGLPRETAALLEEEIRAALEELSDDR